MRYRVEVAVRPDGLYAVWGGQVYYAQRSIADGTVLLGALSDSEPPDDFDTEWQDSVAKVVPAADVDSIFEIHTLARYDDEYYRITGQTGDDELTLRWTGGDEALAARLGLDRGVTTVDDVDNLTALWQERRDSPTPAAARPEPGSAEPAAEKDHLLRSVGRTLRETLPAGWQRAAAQFRQVGDYSELEVRAVGADDDGPVVVSLSPPPLLGRLFTRLRATMYEAGQGAWLQGTYTLDTESNFDFDYDTSAEPAWRLGPGDGSAAGEDAAREHETELEYFPRDRANVPAWLAAKAGLPVEITFRHAWVVDGHTEGHPPVVNRAPVPPEEVRGLLSYLYRAPVVWFRHGLHPDIFAPAAAPDVPDAFHTDGSWIWPAAVPHYLRKYGLPPEDELLAHIRAAGHRPPYVDRVVRQAAQAELTGTAAPRAVDPDADPGVVTRVDRGEEPGGNPRASEILTVLQRRLAEYGVAESAYRIGDAAEGAWCLRRTRDGWEVARHVDGAPTEAQYFASVEPAARCLLGTLLLYPGRAAGDSSDEAGPAAPAPQVGDWPIAPLRGEPPLSFFRHIRMIVLPAGTALRRFGNEGGNLVHPEGTGFAETSLTVDREYEQHTYLVRRPLRVLTGVTIAWGGLPGGAIAHLLPRAVGHHVGNGALERT